MRKRNRRNKGSAMHRNKPVPRNEKCTEEIKLKLGEIMKADLTVEAAEMGFESVNPLIRKILREYLYGKCGHRRDYLPETFGD